METASRAKDFPRIADNYVKNSIRPTAFTRADPMALPILVVDDSALARKVLTKSLPEDWDVEVSYATNGVEALEQYRAGKASVMFLDLTMPDMNGYEVLEILKQEELNTFVIVVSADVQLEAQ